MGLRLPKQFGSRSIRRVDCYQKQITRFVGYTPPVVHGVTTSTSIATDASGKSFISTSSRSFTCS